MAEYIDKQAFLEEQRHLYCENCEKRKGMKRGKMQFVYEIGDAPCRACGYRDVLDDLEDFPAADVRPAAHGQWIYDCERTMGDGWTYKQRHCSECGYQTVECDNFCQHCGADMREADNEI